MNDLYRDLEFDEILNEVMGYCYFDKGKDIIRRIRPAKSYLSVTRNLSLTSETLMLLNLAEEYDLDGVSDFSAALEMSKKDMMVNGNALLAIRNHNILNKKLRSKINKSDHDVKTLKDLVNTITLLNDLEMSINTKINNFGDVLESASPKLKDLKAEERSFNNSFDRIVKGYIQSNSSKLAEDIASERNGRVVVLISSTYKNKMPGIVHGESQSGQSVYFEPEQFIKLNNRRQSIRNLIQEEIDTILFELSQEVKMNSDALAGNLETLAQFDATLAMAKWGYDREAIIATINQDKEIYLKKVAHPLIDSKKVVRNTYNMVDDRILIISGPNTGGKTVTLKTIGLSVLMTLCGLPILAEEASIPLVENIFVDLGDEQSVVNSLSTFSSHLTKLAEITNHVSDNSLVLLDELGGGTDPKEGEALALAVLEYLESKEAIVVVTTHLAALKKYAQINDKVILASVEFDDESLMPTYRFIEGLAGQSNALEIAERYGIKKEIINQAYQNKAALVTEEENLMAKLEKQERQLFQQQEALSKLQTQMKHDQEAIEKEKNRLDHSFNTVVDDANKEAKRIIDEANEKMEFLYNEMKEIHGFAKMHEAIDVRKQAQSTTPKPKAKKKSKHVFKVGDLVKVDNMNHIGEIVELNGKNVTVVINGMRIQTKLNSLEYHGAKKETVKKSNKVSINTKKLASRELNIIGKRVAEGIIDVDRFIDSAAASNMEEVRIVHGMGTGKLRSAVHEHLKKNKHVDTFTYAPANLGGNGATVVKLK